MLKLTSFLLILSLADANWKWYCGTIDKDLWPTTPGCANGGNDSVPAWCSDFDEQFIGCVEICKTVSTPKCNWIGNGNEWCNAIDEDHIPFVPQCKNGGKGDGDSDSDSDSDEDDDDVNAAPSAGGLVMMATMQGVVGALLLTA